MKLDRYEFTTDDDHLLYEFASEGPRGKIIKHIQFCETNLVNVYNLEFGDINLISGKIDDTITTNNGDTRKVLATVASTIYSFTSQYPDSYIHFTGSNKARTRLYRIAINSNLTEISRDFEVYGLNKDRWIPFEKKFDYDAFLIKRKLS
jgi:hypothetical protein